MAKYLNLKNANKDIQWKRGMVYQAKAEYPSAKSNVIARALHISISDVEKVLAEPAGILLMEQVCKDQATYIADIKSKALRQFDKFLNREDIKPDTHLSALKFALGTLMAQDSSKKPDNLIFETMITPAGTIEQTKREESNDMRDLQPDPTDGVDTIQPSGMEEDDKEGEMIDV